MENASKALIIAGAILISILLISLGIMIYNQAKTVTDSQQMDQVAIQQYNSQFEQYVGTKSGAQLRALINQVRASNALDENSERKINFSTSVSGLTTTTVDGATIIDSSSVKTTSKYKITVSYYGSSDGAGKNGLVSTINVES